MARVRPAGERPDDTRERIIDAAQEIFARDGFVGAKMQEIADLVGVQRPSLFYHFKNKEALFVAAHEQVFARIEPVFRESLVPDGDPFVQLDRVTRTVLAVMAEQPGFARMVARTAVDRHPAAVGIVRGYLQPLVDVSVAFVRRCQRRGVFRADVDPFFFTLNSWGAALIYFTARDLLAPSPAPTSSKDRERFTRSLLQMGNRALAPGDRRGARAPPAERPDGRRRNRGDHMQRTIFSEEHELFREQFKKFCAREVTPNLERWEEQRIVDRAAWRKAGEQGFLCPWADPKYGGSGVDFAYSAIIDEEIIRAGSSGFALSLHSDICVPYIASYGTDEQKDRWIPGCVSGELVTAIAMTEPNTGSDLAAIKTSAIRDDGHYVLNGQKTFISNGILCDLVIVAAKTDPQSTHGGVSLFVVEDGTPGFEKGRKLDKMGMHSQDTAEMHFSDCRIPATNLLGSEGSGFYYLMEKLQQERLVCAIGAQAAAEVVLEETIKYTQERTAFGKPLCKFQNTQFKLVEIATEIELGRVFLDRLIAEHIAGTPIVKETSMAKWWITEMCKRNIDLCLQFYGGYGYMEEYPICRAYRDARIQTIFAGTTEIMKIIIAKSMGL